MLTLEQEYYARICERDAEWNVYCHCPTDMTWARYVEACVAVEAAEQKMQPTAFGAGGRGSNSLQSNFLADESSAKHGGR